MDNFMDKVGCNHLVIAGHLESLNYAKADFLAMHLEQHLQFGIDRQGRLECQWPEYYESVLVPLEITSDAIKNGETVVYTREGRVIGDFEGFRTWAKIKYNVDIEYDEERMRAISEVHTKRAQGVIDDANESAFNAKVDSLLERRAGHLQEARQVLAAHRGTVAAVNGAVEDLQGLSELIAPHVANLYGLHHYPVKEENPEEGTPEEGVEGEDTASAEGGQEGESEEPPTDGAQVDGETQPEAATEPAQEAEPEAAPPPVSEPEPEVETEPPSKEGEQNEEEEKGEAPKPKEEEEEPEPDAEALDVLAKLQEGLKFQPLEKCAALVKSLKSAGKSWEEFFDDIETRKQKINQLVAAEKFRWKAVEREMLQLQEAITVITNLLTITILSAEELRIKAVQAEISNWDDFLIPDEDPVVLEAAIVKFGATFKFV